MPSQSSPHRSISDRFANFDSAITARFKLPVALHLYRLGLTANRANNLGLLGCLVAGGLATFGMIYLSAILFLGFSALDYFDGSIAKIQGTYLSSILGGWRDAFYGLFAELTFLACLSIHLHFQWIGSLVIATVAIGSYAKSVAGEYAVAVQWGEARYLGRGVRIITLTGTLLVCRVLQDATNALTMSFLTTEVVALSILVYRVFKITRTGVKSK